MSKNFLVVSVILTLAAGCMAEPDIIVDPDLPTYAERRAIDVTTVTEMVDRYDAEGQATYKILPANDTAVYRGILDMEVVNLDDESIQFVGDMEATVTFGPAKVTGTITNFQDNFDVYHEGTLYMESTGFTNTIDPNHVVNFNKEFTGSVDLPEGQLAILATGSNGDFTGSDRDFMAGEAYGDVTLDGVPSGTVEIDYAVQRE